MSNWESAWGLGLRQVTPGAGTEDGKEAFEKCPPGALARLLGLPACLGTAGQQDVGVTSPQVACRVGEGRVARSGTPTPSRLRQGLVVALGTPSAGPPGAIAQSFEIPTPPPGRLVLNVPSAWPGPAPRSPGSHSLSPKFTDGPNASPRGCVCLFCLCCPESLSCEETMLSPRPRGPPLPLWALIPLPAFRSCSGR